MNAKTKNLRIQELRALCIIAVILIHLAQGSVESNSYDYWMSFRRIINFPVAIFIFLAGYFSSFDGSKQTIIQFYKKRFIRLLIPFLIWSTFYTLVSLVMNKDVSLSFHTIITIIRGSSAPHLYFILVLLQLILIAPIISNIMSYKNNMGLYFLLIITPIYLILLYYYNISTNSSFSWYHESFFAWMIFYVLGVAYRNNLIKINLSTISKFGIVVFAAILSLAEMTYLNSLGLPSAFSISQVTFSSFFYSIAIIILLFNDKAIETANKLLVKIGDYSFGIYFIHIFILRLISIGIIRCCPECNSFPLFLLYQIICALLTLVISYCIVKIASEILSDKWVQILGIK